MSSLAAEKAVDLYVVREMLEGMAARLAAASLTTAPSQKCPNAFKGREK